MPMDKPMLTALAAARQSGAISKRPSLSICRPGTNQRRLYIRGRLPFGLTLLAPNDETSKEIE